MDYVVVSGASRKNEKWEHVEGETVSVEGKSEAEKLATDPMYRLEHGAEDKRKAEEAAPRLARLIVSHMTSHMTTTYHTPYSPFPRTCRRKRWTTLI